MAVKTLLIVELGCLTHLLNPYALLAKAAGQSIDITIGTSSTQISGASQIENRPFDDKTNFIDLHLDFQFILVDIFLAKQPL